jgi:hypothetical protein
MRKFTSLILLIIIYSSTAIAQQGFNGGGGFSFYLAKPDFGAINGELQGLDMPEIDNVMLLYGGQAFAHVSNRLRVGGMGFGGSTTVGDMEGGYAREVCVHLAWGGFLAEYIIWEGKGFEAYAGGTIGWGSLSVQTEKIADPASWEEIWGSLEPGASPEDNLSSELSHSFFMGQSRLGLRYYLTTWLALSGSFDFTLFNLSSSGWELNGKEVYNAPSMDISQPFFQFAVLIGG